jgi:hypothetical protein
MDDPKKNKFFLLIELDQITFVVLNELNKIILTKKSLTKGPSLEEKFKALENFLDQNIFDIEKEINNHIKEINLIINYDGFLTIEVSSSQNYNNYSNYSDKFSNLLVNLKNSVITDSLDYDLTHMIINKFIIDGKEYSSIPKDSLYNNIIFEIRFVCLKKNISQSLKTIFSKYEIMIKNITSYKYVSNFKNSVTDNIFDLTDKLKNGLNQNEILLFNKPTKNKGFFEKFFDFFS